MSGETQRDESGWTVDTLKAHFDDLREADQRALAAALASAEKATLKTEQADVKYRESQNEWRGALQDRERAEAAQLERYAQKESVETLRVTLQNQIDDLKQAGREDAGHRAGVKVTAGVLVAALSALGAFIAIIVFAANLLTSKT